MQEIKSRARPSEEQRCPYCRDTFLADEPETSCAGCASKHHEECWEELGRCAVCAAGADGVAGAGEAGGEVVASPPERGRRRAALRRRWRRELPEELRVSPPGVEVVAHDRRLVLRRRWRQPIGRTWAVLAAALAYLVALAVYTPWQRGPDGASPQALLWLALVGAVVVPLAYSTLCSLLNRAEIEMTRGRLTVRHGPLPAPWALTHDLVIPDLEQLYAAEQAEPYSELRLEVGGSQRDVRYELRARFQRPSGRSQDVVLLDGLDDLAEARFLARRIEVWLGIEARRAPGRFGDDQPKGAP